jgi:hypothetical protein
MASGVCVGSLNVEFKLTVRTLLEIERLLPCASPTQLGVPRIVRSLDDNES